MDEIIALHVGFIFIKFLGLGLESLFSGFVGVSLNNRGLASKIVLRIHYRLFSIYLNTLEVAKLDLLLKRLSVSLIERPGQTEVVKDFCISLFLIELVK